jgi:hypothetical protein
MSIIAVTAYRPLVESRMSVLFEFLTKLVRNYIASNDEVKVYLPAMPENCLAARDGGRSEIEMTAAICPG